MSKDKDDIPPYLIEPAVFFLAIFGLVYVGVALFDIIGGLFRN
jgi:hypothetical protein